eukprot:TRINITY_DN7539_c0_g1_i1.p1 TRINITY_DN7539_c0_g1~~TRINITY_DN7539_c0_g1_i1.p1  ORF type:complete len:136 (-),score=25.01 TRINITY_DN7539_c0_g1_i1:184-591(-)
MLKPKQRSGALLSAFGVFLVLVGILLFFEPTVLTAGNFTFFIGASLIIGFRKTQRWLQQRNRLKGTISLIVGTIITIFGWSVIGTIFVVYGYFDLFGNFSPVVLAYLRRLPFLNVILNYEPIKKQLDKWSSNLPV